MRGVLLAYRAFARSQSPHFLIMFLPKSFVSALFTNNICHAVVLYVAFNLYIAQYTPLATMPTFNYQFFCSCHVTVFSQSFNLLIQQYHRTWGNGRVTADNRHGCDRHPEISYHTRDKKKHTCPAPDRLH